MWPILKDALMTPLIAILGCGAFAFGILLFWGNCPTCYNILPGIIWFCAALVALGICGFFWTLYDRREQIKTLLHHRRYRDALRQREFNSH